MAGIAVFVISLAWAVTGVLADTQGDVSDMSTHEVRVHVPLSVWRGQAFICRFQPIAHASQYTLHWLDKTLSLPGDPGNMDTDVEVLLGAGLLRKTGNYPLVLTYVLDGHTHTQRHTVEVKAREYPVQRLTLPNNMVNLSKKNLARHYKEKKEVTKALAVVSPDRLWTLPLIRPVPGTISSAFGLQRFINGQPRTPHRGVDFRGAVGVPIKACAAGRVGLVGNHYFAGRCVYIDHGQGVVSMYFHLSHVRVHQGQMVGRGEIIGRVGKTGRVTGPHLHVGVYVLGEAVDPLDLMQGRL